MSVLSLVDVHFAYRRRRRSVAVLNGVSLTIERGERVALIGRSGEGKSTLLNTASGRLVPSSGEVTLDGAPLSRLSADARATVRLHHVAHVYQDFKLLPRLTALENVALRARLLGAAPGRARAEAAETLERVGLGHRLGHRPAELSGGERQRVAIARAVVAPPSLLLADEPTGALDATLRDEILSLLYAVAEHSAVLVVTHDPLVAATTDRSIEIRKGSVDAAGRDEVPHDLPQSAS